MSSVRRVACVAAALLLIGGCSGRERPASPAARSPYACIVGINVKGSTDQRAVLDRLRKRCARLSAATLPAGDLGSLAARGRGLVISSGCLACHRIGQSGNQGPGPDLSDVRRRLPAAAITRAMRSVVAPMPSFASLGASRLAAITAYLESLPGG